MTSKTMCPWCQARPSADGLLCQDGPKSCTARLQAALAGVPRLVEAAGATYTRSARLGSGGVGQSDVQPMPFDPRVTVAVRELAAAVNLVAAMAGVGFTVPTGERALLTSRLVSSQLRSRVAPGDLSWFTSLMLSVGRLEAVIDVPDPGQYVGQCNQILPPPPDTPGQTEVCGTDLYAKEKAAFVRCPRCAQQWPVQERRRILLDAVDDQVVNANVVARSLTSLGDEVSADRIYQWAHRNRLLPVSRDAKGHPLYRIGDVRQLLREDEERRAARRARATSRNADRTA